MTNYKILVLVVLTSIMFILLLFNLAHTNNSNTPRDFRIPAIRSIDTMKYSRDLSREKANDPSFDQIINKQIADISSTGATYVAIDTPYDEEFIPMLKKWVTTARNYHLKVWFRGNWSGWEGWFDYPLITPSEHIQKTKQFILTHSDLFVDGDIFTSCVECENGNLGDPRKTNRVVQYRNFLIEEYQASKNSFTQIGKNVPSNFYSTNYDVAKLIMDKPTTRALGGIVVIDHNTPNPTKLKEDIKELAQSSGGKIVLGEFGAPILEIHGQMNDQQQAQWLKETLTVLFQTPEIIGLNYWTSVGGSTQLWTPDGISKPSSNIIRQFYSLK